MPYVQVSLNERKILNLSKCPHSGGYLLWRDLQKVSTVQNREVSTFERFISSKKCLGGPKGVHNAEVSTLERCPHREVSLYMNSFILHVYSFLG